MDGCSDADVREALVRVLPGFAPGSDEFSCNPLDGGINRRSFLLTVRDRQYVLRRPVVGAAGLLTLAAEAQVMQAAADAGLAPRVVGVDPASGLLLTEYLASTVRWTTADIREPGNIDRIASLLRVLHQVPSRAPKFGAAQITARYLAAPGTQDSALVSWRDELVALAHDYDANYPATALCHNDLVAANVLDDGGLKLIDFEYAVRAAPVLDLANLTGMNDFTPAQCRHLLDAYYRRSVPFTAAQFDDVVRMVRLMAFFWALVAERQVVDAAAYSQVAERMAYALK